MKTILLSSETGTEVINKESKPSALTLLVCKCPRCRRGDMFMEKNPWKLKSTMKMNRECPVCKQPFDLEVGFYYGSSYVSYALTVALSVVTFIVYGMIMGPWSERNILFWLIVNAVILVLVQPYLMRFARTMWLAFFVRYERAWKTKPPARVERTNKEQQNNW